VADHWFEPIAEHLGRAYLRYSFTKGTVQEVDFLVETLGLEPGMRVLDVGCGPGRHSHELARRGVVVAVVDHQSEGALTQADRGVELLLERE
jgi:cyclopropane fatty-acyl-phospholipid synthase-like methyltransferase